MFAALNVGAAASPASSGAASPTASGGTRRVRTLIGVGLVGAVAAIAFPLAGARPRRRGGAAVALAFGVLGFNGIVYLIAGELGGPQRRAPPSVLASTVVFLSARSSARVRRAGGEGGLQAMYLSSRCMLAGAVSPGA